MEERQTRQIIVLDCLSALLCSVRGGESVEIPFDDDDGDVCASAKDYERMKKFRIVSQM